MRFILLLLFMSFVLFVSTAFSNVVNTYTGQNNSIFINGDQVIPVQAVTNKIYFLQLKSSYILINLDETGNLLAGITGYINLGRTAQLIMKAPIV